MSEAMNVNETLNLPIPLSLAYNLSHQSQASVATKMNYMVASNSDSNYLFTNANNSNLNMNNRSSSGSNSVDYPFNYDLLFHQNVAYGDHKNGKEMGKESNLNNLPINYFDTTNQLNYNNLYEFKPVNGTVIDTNGQYQTSDDLDSNLNMNNDNYSNKSPTEETNPKLTFSFNRPKVHHSPEAMHSEFLTNNLEVNGLSNPLATPTATNNSTKLNNYPYPSYYPYMNPYQFSNRTNTNLNPLTMNNYNNLTNLPTLNNSSLNMSMGMNLPLNMNPMMDPYSYNYNMNMNMNSKKIYSFVTMNTIKHKKRFRRKFEEIERVYKCNFKSCEKSYGTLNNLNAHILMQKHGNKRSAFEFKDCTKRSG